MIASERMKGDEKYETDNEKYETDNQELLERNT